MDKKEIKSFLENNQGYLKWGKKKLARKFRASIEDVREALFEIKDSQPRNFKRLFFDIETSYNQGKFWRTGYKEVIRYEQILIPSKIICVSWKWEGEDKVYNINWDRHQNDLGLLRIMSDLMLEADEVIAHNGDRFDLKWLRTRCLKNRIPFPTYVRSLDTLKKVKSMFNFENNKLNTIAQELGYGEKIKTDMSLWDKIILEKDKQAMVRMLEYCDHDVVLLEDVYSTIMPYVKPNTHVAIHNGGDKCDCPSCGSNNVSYIKPMVTGKGNIQRHMMCDNCTSDYVISNADFKIFIKRD